MNIQDNVKTDPIDVALGYSLRGWRVLPLHTPTTNGKCSCRLERCPSPGKHPRTKNGVKDATVDLKLITEWWNRWPDANLGIATGKESGVVVLDVDPRHEGDISLRSLEGTHGVIESTIRSLTGGGGEHIFFRAPNESISNKVSLVPGLDVRAEGGYVVAPPSIHASLKSYAWSVDHHPDDVVLASFPPWLLRMCEEARPPQNWQKTVSSPIQAGNRNNTLASLSGYLLRCGVNAHVTLELLLAWNQKYARPPISEAEATSVVNSIAGRELRRLEAKNGQRRYR